MYIFDTFTNFLSGLGVVGRDKMTAHHYTKQLWSRDQLEASFQSDWIARKAISIPAMDATRQWRAWQAEADQIELLEETEDRLRVQLKIQEGMIKARLYGGACILIGVDGNMKSELDPETIKKDGLKFLHVLAPHQLAVQDIIKDISSPYYGQPEFYRLTDESGKVGSVDIHPSRMIRLTGLDNPDAMANYGWGDPVLQMINDAVSAAGTVQQSIAAMISEAKFDVVKIPGLTEIFSTSEGTARLIKRFSEANVAKSIINAVVLDGEEEWQRIGVDFSGMPEIMQMYLQIAAGAADIPATRFLGQSPNGLNATGDSDLINYYDRIKSDQELRLTPALEKLDIAIQMSALGKFDPDIFYEWNSLWQMSETEKATIAKMKADQAAVDVTSGLVPFEALVKGRCNQLVEDGTYPGLEAGLEEAIANQESLDEEALAAEEEAQQQIGGPGQKLLPPPKGRGMEGQAQGEVAKDSTGPFSTASTRAQALDRLTIALRDLLVPFDPTKHARDPGGQGGGQFVAMGGPEYMTKSSSFVSPSVKTGLDIKSAQRELNSRQQTRMRTCSKDIYDRLDIHDVREVDVLGVWKDGKETYAENSLMSRAESNWNRNVLSAVMKGYIADQKAVIVFQQSEEGKGVLAQFEAKGTINAISKNLQKDGIENYTIVPKDGGATVYMVDFDGKLIDTMDKAATRYGKDNSLYYQTGRAELIGNGDYSGTDRDQRDRAREVYQRVIDESPVEEARAIWEDVRNHWLPPYEQEGYNLTSMAIIAENPNIKHNSVKVNEAGAMINDRAGKILEEKFGVDHIDEDNHTPEMDEYLANVIAMELREALISGKSGADWYDKTMREAMEIAEKIYPGMKADKNKHFAYTVSLAITSQGEVVSRSAELADIAYTQFLETGKFPEDIASKDKNIKGNFKKMNTLIDELGIDGAREFFDKDMTVGELTEATGVSPGATAVTDRIQGSAYLGPKIGQGFYQNLNGNFDPITMDLWFMRSWGRITNTGVGGGGDINEQIERVKRALHEGGMPTPRSDEKVIEVASEIYEAHEKAFAAHQKAQKAKPPEEREKYQKTELILASERLSMNAEGSLRQQPKNSKSRRWSTEVFNRATEIVEDKMGIKLTPAGAQATWWWPEKVLWEEMGTTAKERDTDYKKSLTDLAKRKGISV